MHAFARVRAHACACVRDMLSIYDNNISPGLIMIIIKNIIIYFIQMKHIDDLPSTGTRLVGIIYTYNSLNNVMMPTLSLGIGVYIINSHISNFYTI